MRTLLIASSTKEIAIILLAMAFAMIGHKLFPGLDQGIIFVFIVMVFGAVAKVAYEKLLRK